MTPDPHVEIISLNALSDDRLASLDPETRELVERRRRVMGPAYRLFYDEPLRPVRAFGTKIIDARGDEYLDAYNNVASVGHNHPHVVAAVHRQLQTINTNTRYLQPDIIDYAENLVATHDAALDNVMFTCTGSEANDLALRVARVVSGGTGVIVTENAYHGCTRDVASWSPASGTGAMLGRDVRLVPAPDTYRYDAAQVRELFLNSVQTQIDDLARRGVRLAALVVDSIFSSDGIYPDPGVLAAAADLVHRAGGLIISDEVQPGFARTGAAMWGYQRSGFTPDLATMGKPMGNGMPVAGMVAQSRHLDAFAEDVAYFNTFGGENAPIAAAQAVLEVIEGEGLMANSRDKGDQLVVGFRTILDRAGFAADVRGSGLYVGVELVHDPVDKDPDAALTSAFVNGLRDRKVLTSAAGTYGNVIKIRPPLVFSQSDTDRLLAEFEHVARDLAAGRSPGRSVSVAGWQPPNRDDLRRLIAEELRDMMGGSRG